MVTSMQMNLRNVKQWQRHQTQFNTVVIALLEEM